MDSLFSTMPCTTRSPILPPPTTPFQNGILVERDPNLWTNWNETIDQQQNKQKIDEFNREEEKENTMIIQEHVLSLLQNEEQFDQSTPKQKVAKYHEEEDSTPSPSLVFATIDEEKAHLWNAQSLSPLSSSNNKKKEEKKNIPTKTPIESINTTIKKYSTISYATALATGSPTDSSTTRTPESDTSSVMSTTSKKKKKRKKKKKKSQKKKPSLPQTSSWADTLKGNLKEQKEKKKEVVVDEVNVVDENEKEEARKKAIELIEEKKRQAEKEAEEAAKALQRLREQEEAEAEEKEKQERLKRERAAIQARNEELNRKKKEAARLAMKKKRKQEKLEKKKQKALKKQPTQQHHHQTKKKQPPPKKQQQKKKKHVKIKEKESKQKPKVVEKPCYGTWCSERQCFFFDRPVSINESYDQLERLRNYLIQHRNFFSEVNS